jgi:hypothetical protein
MKTDKSEKQKSFDAVKMMRDIRDRISRETANMSYEELKRYIQARLKDSGIEPAGK